MLRNMTSIYLYDDNDRMLMLYRIGSRAIKDSYIGTNAMFELYWAEFHRKNNILSRNARFNEND